MRGSVRVHRTRTQMLRRRRRRRKKKRMKSKGMKKRCFIASHVLVSFCSCSFRCRKIGAVRAPLPSAKMMRMLTSRCTCSWLPVVVVHRHCWQTHGDESHRRCKARPHRHLMSIARRAWVGRLGLGRAETQRESQAG